MTAAASVAERAAIVAATLRFLADGWVYGDDNQKWLRSVAEQIDLEPPAEAACCPLCAEVECDGHCPLAEARPRG